MVEVKFYENTTARKNNEVLGVFNIKINPEVIPEVSDNLKGKIDSQGNDMYAAATERRAARVERAILDCKCAALNKVRSIVGEQGVLVASIELPKEEPTEKAV